MQSRIVILLLMISFSSVSQATCLGLGCTCNIAANPIAFGNYNPVSPTPSLINGNVAITCTALVLGLAVGYEIQLSTGSSGIYSQRTMTDGTNTLNYNIYADSARTQIWGNNTGGSVSVLDNYLLNISPTTRNYTSYGQLPAGQNIPTGNYSDTITATVIF